jgi:flagella basal body P-ring formation protein FlgA
MGRRRTAVLWLLALALPALAWPGATAHAQDIAIVTTRVVYPGETITPGELRGVPIVNRSRDLSTVATRVEQIDGRVTRRTLLPGHYIPLAFVRDAYTVEQGAAVRVLFVNGGLTISASGVTLQPGSAGDVIKVRNLDSGSIITGIVMADGTVRVGAT